MRSDRSFLRPAAALLALTLGVGLFASAGTAHAQSRIEEGQTFSLTVGNLPSSYGTYWVSSLDGYIAYGNTLRTSKLSVGSHTISALVYYLPTSRLVWQGGLDVIVTAKPAPTPTPTPAPTPTPSTPTNPTTPSGPALVAPGEFEPVSAVLLGCDDAYMVEDLYPEMIRGVAGAAEFVIHVDSDYPRYDLQDAFRRAGIQSGYRFVTVALDSIWMRDYGPQFVRNNGRLEVRDLQYYPDRRYDDAFTQRYAQQNGLTNRQVQLYWEGGNLAPDGQGRVFASTQLQVANSNRSAAQISSIVRDNFGAELVVLERMLNDGGTGHLDMSCLLLGARKALVNQFPSNHQNYGRMNRNAQTLQQIGFSTRRIDTADRGFRSHTNGVIVNGRVLVPTYGRGTDQAALNHYQAEGLQPYGIDCSRIIEWSGALHCITITVPRS